MASLSPAPAPPQSRSPPPEVKKIPIATPAPSDSMNGSSSSKLWQESLERVGTAIVVIRVCSPSAFDGDSPSYSHATGFVVDKSRGIILTNRHVLTPGPAVADAVFMNKEEVDLVPIYYDPVHDFGFFRFDPSALRFLDVAEIELNPDGAKVGVEIRVVGNDSGEKLSILPGILARLDRAAPDYGRSSYHDFNTFYLAAASSTSGGSSGSPVLTIDGKAVALNCGSRAETAAAFYLPLSKIVRALDLLRRGERVSRGTIQTVLKHTAFDEARRLGLSENTEAALRKEFPEETGVLVVEQVIPEGPAHEVLDPGDVVVSLNDELVTTFLPWESCLDSTVGGEVEVKVERGGKEITRKLTVGDLHEITPSEYLEVSSGVLHPLSYQQARIYNLPVEGVYLAQAGYMMERAWISSQCLITSVGTDPTPDLDTCEAALCKHPDGARVALRYKALTDRHRIKTAVITMDRKWFPMQRVRRNDSDGLWHTTPSPLPPPPQPTPASMEGKQYLPGMSTVDGNAGGEYGAGSSGGERIPPLGNASSVAASVSSSLVMVSFDIPHLVDGVSSSYCLGVGAIVDKELGLVVVDRTTVQVALGDVMLTFNGSEEVAASPIFVHPTQNFSVVRFDPSTVKGAFDEVVLSARETDTPETHEPPRATRSPLPSPPPSPEQPSSSSSPSTSPPSSLSSPSWLSILSSSSPVTSSLCSGHVSNGHVGAPAGSSSSAVDSAAADARSDGVKYDERKSVSPQHCVETLPRNTVLTTPISAPVSTSVANEDGNPSPPPSGSVNTIACPANATPTAAVVAEARESRAAASAASGAGDGLDPPPLRPGDAAEFHGLTSANAPVRQRTVAVKLERLSLASSSHPQFTAHSVEVLQFEHIASCLGGVFVALPRDDDSDNSNIAWPVDGARPKVKTATAPSSSSSPSSSSAFLYRPIVSAFWHSFSYSDSDGRKQIMRGLPAPVVRRSIDRIRRDLYRRRSEKYAAEAAAAATAAGSGGKEEANGAGPAELRAETQRAQESAESSSRGGTAASLEAVVAVSRDQEEVEPEGERRRGSDEGCAVDAPGSVAVRSGVDERTELKARVEGGGEGEGKDVKVKERGELSGGVGDIGGNSAGSQLRAPLSTVPYLSNDVGAEEAGGGCRDDASGDSDVQSNGAPLSPTPSPALAPTGDASQLSESLPPEKNEASHTDQLEAAAPDSLVPPDGSADDGDTNDSSGTGTNSRDKACCIGNSESDGAVLVSRSAGVEMVNDEKTVGQALHTKSTTLPTTAESSLTRTGLEVSLEGAINYLGAAPALPLQLVTVQLSKARAGLGLSEAWSKRVEKKCGERQKQVLEVRRCMAGTPAFGVIETGDIILAVEGQVVTRFTEVERATEAMHGEPVRLTVLRQNQEKEVSVVPSYLPTRETDRLFMWAGLMIQAPHLAVLQLGFLPKEGGGVYSSRWCYGSPAHKYNLGCTTWIVEVNGIPTPTLDAFLEAVKDIGDKSPVRVKTVGLNSKVEVTTFRTDHHYWPTLELRRSQDGRWTRKLHTGSKTSRPGTVAPETTVNLGSEVRPR